MFSMIMEVLGTQNANRQRVSNLDLVPKLDLDNQVQAIFCFLRLSTLLILIVKIKAHEAYPIFITL